MTLWSPASIWPLCILARSSARIPRTPGPVRLRAGQALHVPLNRITALLAGERAVSADTALRLAQFFGTTAEFWINLQGAYDLEIARIEHGSEIATEVRISEHVELEAR